MVGKNEYHNAIEQVLLTLEDNILGKVKIGEINKRSGDNLRTYLYRFQEFVDSFNVSVNDLLTMRSDCPTPHEIVKKIEEEDYDIEILRKKFQARIAGGQRREFPARILNSIYRFFENT